MPAGSASGSAVCTYAAGSSAAGASATVISGAKPQALMAAQPGGMSGPLQERLVSSVSQRSSGLSEWSVGAGALSSIIIAASPVIDAIECVGRVSAAPPWGADLAPQTPTLASSKGCRRSVRERMAVVRRSVRIRYWVGGERSRQEGYRGKPTVS